MKFDPNLLIRPNFQGILVNVLTEFHCTWKLTWQHRKSSLFAQFEKTITIVWSQARQKVSILLDLKFTECNNQYNRLPCRHNAVPVFIIKISQLYMIHEK